MTTTNDIETIEAMKKAHRPDEELTFDDIEYEEEFETREEENEFYLSILYQMCVAA